MKTHEVVHAARVERKIVRSRRCGDHEVVPSWPDGTSGADHERHEGAIVCSDDASYITSTTLTPDKGFTLTA